MKKPIFFLHKLLVALSLIAVVSAVPGPAFSAAATPVVVLTLTLVEYYPDGRTGTVQIYSLPASGYGSHMGALDPSLKPYDTGLGVVTTWNSKGGCGGSFLAGGTQVGWLLGPVTDKSIIQSYDPYASLLYGVITGMYGDIGYAVGNNCDGSTYKEKWSYWLIFLRTNPGYYSGQGYLVGDGLYVTERYQKGNWYYIYSNRPL